MQRASKRNRAEVRVACEKSKGKSLEEGGDWIDRERCAG